MTELNPFTFIIAVINFLILVGILYRLLHKPLLGILKKRKDEIEENRASAQKATAEAERVRDDYSQKLQGIHDERDRVLAEAKAQAEKAGESLLQKAAEKAEEETARKRKDWDRERRDAFRSLEDDVVALVLDLSRRVLSKLDHADGNLHTRLLQGFHSELAALAEKDRRRIREEVRAARGPVRITTARDLDEAARLKIERTVKEIAGTAPPFDYVTREDLIAGIRADFGTLAIDASLGDVLGGLREKYQEEAESGGHKGSGGT